SQTELAIKLRGKARLGSELNARPNSDESTTLQPAEQRALDQLQALAPGCWFEFRPDTTADPTRGKLCWSSPATGRCLLVDALGRPRERTLVQRAREIAGGRACAGDENPPPLVERAWREITEMLKNFSTRKTACRFAAPPLARTTHDDVPPGG